MAEHAGMRCFGVEAQKMENTIIPCISTACNDNQHGAKGAKTPQVAEAGLEPALPYGKGILNPYFLSF